MNNPLYRNIQNIDGNKTVNFGVSITEVKIKLILWKRL